MGVIYFNGKSSKDFGIEVETYPGLETPERDYDVYHVPGRNGDLLIDKRSYKNIPRSYQISSGSYDSHFIDVANRISEWLHSASGYARLEDSYDPECYRLAMYKQELNVANFFDIAGRATIQFECKPQRFLKAGEEKITVTSSRTLTNFTQYDALPLLTVFGSSSGTLTIGNYTITISAISTSVTIDCDIQEAYSGVLNKNSTISVPSGFPKLIPGENAISFTGGITSVEVIPRWWIL